MYIINRKRSDISNIRREVRCCHLHGQLNWSINYFEPRSTHPSKKWPKSNSNFLSIKRNLQTEQKTFITFFFCGDADKSRVQRYNWFSSGVVAEKLWAYSFKYTKSGAVNAPFWENSRAEIEILSTQYHLLGRKFAAVCRTATTCPNLLTHDAPVIWA